MHQSFATGYPCTASAGDCGDLNTWILLSRCPSSVVAVRAFNFLPNIAEEVETEQLWWCWGYLLGFYQNFSPRCRAYTRTLFVKHYAPNHMPDPKGGWSLKENTSGLHHGICSKVNQFIYTLVCNYMQNIRILAKSGSSDIFS